MSDELKLDGLFPGLRAEVTSFLRNDVMFTPIDTPDQLGYVADTVRRYVLSHGHKLEEHAVAVVALASRSGAVLSVVGLIQDPTDTGKVLRFEAVLQSVPIIA